MTSFNVYTAWQKTQALVLPRAVFLTVAFLLLPAGSVQAADPNASRSPPVHPSTLEGASPLELHELLAVLLREPLEKLDWSHLPALDHQWLKNGEVTLSKLGDRNMQVRQAAVRVRVNGKSSTVQMKSRRAELAWTMTYIGNLNESKPGIIRIEPGLEGEPCFGIRYGGCSFDLPIEALRANGASVSPICSMKDGSDTTSAYSISFDGLRPAVVVWSESVGSGGVTSTVELLLRSNARNAACGEESDQSNAKTTESAPTTSQRSGLIDFDQNLAGRATTFRTMVTRTKLCMYEAAQSMLRLGAREAQQVVTFQVNTCGSPLQQHMVRLEGRPVGETNAFLAALAYEQLQRATRY